MADCQALTWHFLECNYFVVLLVVGFCSVADCQALTWPFNGARHYFESKSAFLQLDRKAKIVRGLIQFSRSRRRIHHCIFPIPFYWNSSENFFFVKVLDVICVCKLQKCKEKKTTTKTVQKLIWNCNFCSAISKFLDTMFQFMCSTKMCTSNILLQNVFLTNCTRSTIIGTSSTAHEHSQCEKMSEHGLQKLD